MPFRVPKICDSCVFYHGRRDAFQVVETCDTYPQGIPEPIVYLGEGHFSGKEPVYFMDIGGEDALSAWIHTWYTADDDRGLAEGVLGIPGPPPTEPDQG